VSTSRAAFEALERGDDADPARPHRVREPDIHDRDHTTVEKRRVGALGSDEPQGGEIRDGNAADAGCDPVDDRRREMHARDTEQLARHAERGGRTMLGGVRTESSTSLAPPSARSTAISAPELPLPTTRTRRPRYGEGLR
jgi:hypothetical protein